MFIGNSDDITWCIHEALVRDLPGIVIPAREIRGREFPERIRRPDSEEIEVHAWVQSWSDTSLGMGGMAGQAISGAFTTVVQTWNHAAVYVCRTLRGVVHVDNEWREKIAAQQVIKKRYPLGKPVDTESTS